MVERLKGLWTKVLEWWNRFTAKQKTAIIGVAAAVIFAFAILIWVFSQPTFVELGRYETTAEAAKVVELLKGADLEYQTSTDGLQVMVKEEDKPTAALALGAAGFTTTTMTIDDVTSGGFSTTESDKQKRYVALRQSELENIIESMPAVKMAWVQLSVPEQDGTLIATTQETSAAIFLELQGDFTEENAAYVARAVATSLGNTTTNNITILDMGGRLLFSGSSEISVGDLPVHSLLQDSSRRIRLLIPLKGLFMEQDSLILSRLHVILILIFRLLPAHHRPMMHLKDVLKVCFRRRRYIRRNLRVMTVEFREPTVMTMMRLHISGRIIPIHPPRNQRNIVNIYLIHILNLPRHLPVR